MRKHKYSQGKWFWRKAVFRFKASPWGKAALWTKVFVVLVLAPTPSRRKTESNFFLLGQARLTIAAIQQIHFFYVRLHVKNLFQGLCWRWAVLFFHFLIGSIQPLRGMDRGNSTPILRPFLRCCPQSYFFLENLLYQKQCKCVMNIGVAQIRGAIYRFFIVKRWNRIEYPLIESKEKNPKKNKQGS